VQATGVLPANPNRQTVLAANGGDKFVELLWRLSLHALRTACRAAYGEPLDSLLPCEPSRLGTGGVRIDTLLDIAHARVALDLNKCAAPRRAALCALPALACGSA
jgi:hypothetical protein